MQRTAYFDAVRRQSDRAFIWDEWIERAIAEPMRRVRQRDGRWRCWIRIPEHGNRVLRVVLLADGQTVHNAFFDRRFTS